MVVCYAVLFSCYFQGFLHLTKLFYNSKAVAQKCSVKKVFLEISQNSLEKQVCQSLFFNKVAGLRPEPLVKKRPWHWCFPVNFANFLRTPFLTKQLQWLLLRIV